MSRDERFFTLPNLISIFRLCLLPVVYLLMVDGKRNEAFFLVVFLAASDWVDGYLARATGQVTELGKLLDPLADRLMVAVIVYSLFAAEIIPAAVMAAFLLREVAALAGFAVFAMRGVKPAVTSTGKTVAAVVYIFLTLSIINSTLAGILWIAALIYWVSLVLYLKKS